MKGFLSLKWQAVVFVSVILIIGGGLFAFYGKQGLEQAYANDRERRFVDRRYAIEASLLTIQSQLIRLAGHMQGLAVEQHAAADVATISSVIGSNWGQLNFEWGVDSIVITDADGRLLNHWGSELDVAAMPDDWARQVLAEEQPLAKIWCPSACVTVALLPIFNTDDSVGLMYFTSSLADVVLQFRAATSANIGILVANKAESETEHQLLQGWDKRVVALTNSATSLPVLMQLASQNSFARAVAADRHLVALGSKNYEVRFLQLTAMDRPDTVSLVVLDDISSDLQALQRAVTGYMLVSLLTTLGAEAVLLLLLWRPMLRLQTVATNLPKLAGQNRAEARRLLAGNNSNNYLLRNEIHNLYDAAILLSDTLDKLDAEVLSRSEHLKKRRQELLEERNFVTRLLNHVHVVILTQNTAGELLLVNAEGKKLLGLQVASSGGALFTSHLLKNDRDSFTHGVEKLLSYQVTEFRQELEFHCASGKLLQMEWYHSCLPNEDREQVTILSVGLDLSDRKKAEENLAWLADHDPLTEIYNRRRFQSEFQKALNVSKRTGEPGAVIFFDIDQFKSFNDTGGHMAGDIILQQIAWRLKREIRETDIIARLGGDEFAVLLENSDQEGVLAFASKLCDQILAVEIQVQDSSYRASISAGVALFPQHGTTIEELMANADFAMYAAKSLSNARNSWQLYSGSEVEKSELKNIINWKTKIQDALDSDGLILHYQPILDIRNNVISHYEALVRMLDKDGGIIAPGYFIPVAEKTGLIYEIDLRVVELAVKALKEFKAQGHKISMAVNLSARAIVSADYVKYVDRLVEDAGLSQSDLIFELTETSAVEDITHAAEIIDEFRRRGFRFSLDDFGVGFSSWYYLRQLAVDYVKLDGSFVKNMVTDFEDRLFVKSINDVVQGLGKQSVAEFVEDEKILQLLTQLGVNYAQGYFIGKPSPTLVQPPSLSSSSQ